MATLTPEEQERLMDNIAEAMQGVPEEIVKRQIVHFYLADKAYGLGVQAMLGAGSLVGFFTVAWPTAEFAGMNIEGAVKLGYRKELAAIEDPEARRAEFDRRVAQAYDTAKAVNAGVGGGIDDVIDPAETRSWIAMGLRSQPPVEPRTHKKHAYIDTW